MLNTLHMNENVCFPLCILLSLEGGGAAALQRELGGSFDTDDLAGENRATLESAEALFFPLMDGEGPLPH